MKSALFNLLLQDKRDKLVSAYHSLFDSVTFELIYSVGFDCSAIEWDDEGIEFFKEEMDRENYSIKTINLRKSNQYRDVIAMFYEDRFIEGYLLELDEEAGQCIKRKILEYEYYLLLDGTDYIQ